MIKLQTIANYLDEEYNLLPGSQRKVPKGNLFVGYDEEGEVEILFHDSKSLRVTVASLPPNIDVGILDAVCLAWVRGWHYALHQ